MPEEIIKAALLFFGENQKATDEELKKHLEKKFPDEEITEDTISDIRKRYEKGQKLEKYIESKIAEQLGDLEPTVRKKLGGVANFSAEKKMVTLVKKPNAEHDIKVEVSSNSLEIMGTYFRAYKKAYKQGDPTILRRAMDELQKKMVLSKEELEIIEKTQNEGDGASGGFLVDIEFERSVLMVMEEYGVAPRLFRSIPMGTDVKHLRGLIGKPTFTAVDEEEAPAQGTKMTFSQPILEAQRFVAFIVSSSELLEDNSTDEEIWALASKLLGEAWAEKLDWLCFMGNLTKIKGIMVSTDPNITDAYLTGSPTGGKTSIADVTFTDLKNLQMTVSTANRKRGVYVMHPDIMNIIDLLQNDIGDYLYFKPGDANRPPTLFGKEIELSDVMPDASMDAPGLKFVAFVNGDVAGVIGRRRSLTLKQLTESTVVDSLGNSVNLATKEMEALRASVRIAFVVGLGEGIGRLSTDDT